MSLPASTAANPSAPVDVQELRALLVQLGQKLDETRQELKTDIQSKLPSSRRFSWVLLFIAVQVVQGIIVVRFTVSSARTALDSAKLPEMTSSYSEALHESQRLVKGLNQNVSALSALVSESTEAWKKHVQTFVRELPKVQEGYERAAGKFSAEATTLPQRIVGRFFEDDVVKKSMATYSAGVTAAAATVQQRSDDGLRTALKSYETRIAGPEALAHFEQQVEHQFEGNKDRISEVLAASAREAVNGVDLREKLTAFWDNGLLPSDGSRPEGWLYRKLRAQAEGADMNEHLEKAVDEALLPPLQKWFEAQLAPQGPLAARLSKDEDKIPAMPQLVTQLVEKSVDAAIELPDGQKLPKLDDVLRDVVKARVNVTLAALAPAKGPVVLTCK
jgi:hypothetical protein